MEDCEMAVLDAASVNSELMLTHRQWPGPGQDIGLISDGL